MASRRVKRLRTWANVRVWAIPAMYVVGAIALQLVVAWVGGYLSEPSLGTGTALSVLAMIETPFG